MKKAGLRIGGVRGWAVFHAACGDAGPGGKAEGVVGGIGFAAARPFTALAFATLVPVFGLAINGIWSARHGFFVDRPGEDAR